MKSLPLLTIACGLAIASIATAGAAKDIPMTRRAEDWQMEVTVRQIFEIAGVHGEIPVVIHPHARGCAYATVEKNRRYIGVDPVCVGPLRKGTAYNFRALGILSHEVGHHVHAAHLRGQNLQDERDADQFAGWALYRMGATLDQALEMPRSMPVDGGKTHPGRAERIRLVTRGWKKAESQGMRIRPLVPAANWWQQLMTTKLPWAVTAGK